MNRAAIYARFSTDLQRDRSIDDQVALCREYAARNDYRIVAVFSDRAISGASIHRRGIQHLLEAAKSGELDFVIAESLSRFARDQEDGHAIRKRLEFSAVKMVTVADGIISPLLHGLRTVIDSQYIDDLKAAVHRGMAGVVRDGRHAGGRAYGYRPVPGKPGELEIIASEAEIVRRIFCEYANGASPREIAARLNEEGAPPPRKGVWRASSIHGHLKRRTGILQNDLYRGRLVWNRTKFLRDPDSRKRIARIRPTGEWQHTTVEHLRIVPEELFEAVMLRRAERSRAPVRFRTVRPKRILSGLLRCGACGGGMSRKDTAAKRPRIGCTRMHDTGTCDHRRSYHLDTVEHAVIGGLRNQLGTPEAIGYFVDCYNAARRCKAAITPGRKMAIERQIAEIDRQIERAVSAVIAGRITEQEADSHLPGLRQRRNELVAELASVSNPGVIVLRSAGIETYLRDLESLQQTINADLERGLEFFGQSHPGNDRKRNYHAGAEWD